MNDSYGYLRVLEDWIYLVKVKEILSKKIVRIIFVMDGSVFEVVV